jgi:hypothetical protein
MWVSAKVNKELTNKRFCILENIFPFRSEPYGCIGEPRTSKNLSIPRLAENASKDILCPKEV